jgi:hypothetical protein
MSDLLAAVGQARAELELASIRRRQAVEASLAAGDAYDDAMDRYNSAYAAWLRAEHPGLLPG